MKKIPLILMLLIFVAVADNKKSVGPIVEHKLAAFSIKAPKSWGKPVAHKYLKGAYQFNREFRLAPLKLFVTPEDSSFDQQIKLQTDFYKGRGTKYKYKQTKLNNARMGIFMIEKYPYSVAYYIEHGKKTWKLSFHAMAQKNVDIKLFNNIVRSFKLK